MHIGKQIKYYRTRKSVRQEDLADYLGVSCQAVSKWETEASLPDITLLPRLAVYFGIAIDDLFRISADDQLDRIENALQNDAELEDCTFQHDREFLESLMQDPERKLRAHILLSALYNFRARQAHQAAIRHAKQALEMDGDADDAWTYLIEGYEAHCGDEWYDNHFELIDFCQHFLSDHPGHFRCLYAMIENMLADKRFEEVVPYVEMLAQLPGRDYQAEIYRGDIAQGMGDLPKAIRCWNQAAEKNPHVWQAFCDRADRMKKLGKYEEALRDYEHCFQMQKAPRISDGLYSKAQLYEQLSDFEQAIEVRERIIRHLSEEWNMPEDCSDIEEQKRMIVQLKRQIKKQ